MQAIYANKNIPRLKKRKEKIDNSKKIAEAHIAEIFFFFFFNVKKTPKDLQNTAQNNTGSQNVKESPAKNMSGSREHYMTLQDKAVKTLQIHTQKLQEYQKKNYRNTKTLQEHKLF